MRFIVCLVKSAYIQENNRVEQRSILCDVRRIAQGSIDEEGLNPHYFLRHLHCPKCRCQDEWQEDSREQEQICPRAQTSFPTNHDGGGNIKRLQRNVEVGLRTGGYA